MPNITSTLTMKAETFFDMLDVVSVLTQLHAFNIKVSDFKYNYVFFAKFSFLRIGIFNETYYQHTY